MIMIQAITETNFITHICTEANRINTSLAKTHIRHLVKLINDMDDSVSYCYPAEVISNRDTKMTFTYNTPTPDMFSGQVKLLPAGYWKYEIYEVSWTGIVAVDASHAPATETDILTPNPTHGIVQGLVAIGKLYLGEKAGTEEVSYTEYERPASTNTIYYGQ